LVHGREASTLLLLEGADRVTATSSMQRPGTEPLGRVIALEECQA
jgi:hypothetical protein